MKEIERSNGRIRYECQGQDKGTPLLLLHGLGADHEMWHPQIAHYPQEGFRLIVPDLRGFGRSAECAAPGTISIEAWVEDLLAILEAEEISCYALAGTSMGGIVAQALAIADSKRISGLILCDTFMDLETVTERLAGWATLQGLRLYARLGKKRLAKLVVSPYRDVPTIATYFRRAVAAADVAAVIAARRSINAVKHKDALAELRVPTLQLVGAKAGAFFVNLNRKIEAVLPNSRLVVLPNGTDPSNMVAPSEFDAQALPFLKSLDIHCA